MYHPQTHTIYGDCSDFLNSHQCGRPVHEIAHYLVENLLLNLSCLLKKKKKCRKLCYTVITYIETFVQKSVNYSLVTIFSDTCYKFCQRVHFLEVYILSSTSAYNRELLHTKKRQDDTCDRLKAVLGEVMISCEIEWVSPEVSASSQRNVFLSTAVMEEMFSLELPNEQSSGSSSSNCVSVSMDNSLSPSHTVIQVHCHDHKGLLYDSMRTLKDYNIQVDSINQPVLANRIYIT